MTKNQKEYRKELNRLKKGYRRYTKMGAIPFNDLGLEIPKRITKKSLNEIKQLKPRKIALFVNEDTGEVIGYNQYKQNRKQTERNTYNDLDRPYSVEEDIQKLLNKIRSLKFDLSFRTNISLLREVKIDYLTDLEEALLDQINIENPLSLGKRISKNSIMWEDELIILYMTSDMETVIGCTIKLLKLIQDTDLTPEQEDKYNFEALVYGIDNNLY